MHGTRRRRLKLEKFAEVGRVVDENVAIEVDGRDGSAVDLVGRFGPDE